MTRHYKQIEKDIKITKQKLKNLNEELRDAHSRRHLTCLHCNKKSQVSKLTYYQHHWYEQPYGGGDEWHEGDGRWHCSHCYKSNRIYEYNYNLWIKDLKYNFKNIEKIYDERG